MRKNYRKLNNKYKKKSRRKKKMTLLNTTLSLALILSVVVIGKEFSNNTDNKIITSNNIEKEAVKNIDYTPKDISMEIVKGSNIINKAKDYAVDMSTVKTMIDGSYTGQEKMVFLTFDDGPSPNTDKVLNILKEKGVHATFFVKGDLLENDAAKTSLKRTIDEGNAIANHSYTHSLELLYPNNILDVDYFIEEFDKTNNMMKSILGENFDSKVLRMPGGYMSRTTYTDPNLGMFDNRLKERGIVSIDWDSLSGDAEGIEYTSDQLVENTIRTSKNFNQTVVLMHDTFGKELTVEALPKIIDYFKENGYEFKVIKSA